MLDWDSNDLSTLDEFEKDVETFHVDMIGQIKRSRVNQKFDSKNEKHRMLLIIDLVQQMMALEFNELKAYLKHFGIDDVGSQRLRELLFLLEKLHYIRAYRFLKHDYYVPGRRTNDFIVYHFVDGTSKIVTDSLRRMNAVSEFYELRDRRRFRALKALERGRANG